MPYLMIDHGGVLEGRPLGDNESPGSNDLVFYTNQPDKIPFILKNGVRIVRVLNDLTTNFGYEIVFHSANAKDAQIDSLRELHIACNVKNIRFPSVKAMAVINSRSESFHDLGTSEEPVEDYLEHTLRVKYLTPLINDGKAALRRALEGVLYLKPSAKERGLHTVFDDGQPIISIAKKEGYRTVHIKSDNDLYTGLVNILRKEKVQRLGRQIKDFSLAHPYIFSFMVGFLICTAVAALLALFIFVPGSHLATIPMLMIYPKIAATVSAFIKPLFVGVLQALQASLSALNVVSMIGIICLMGGMFSSGVTAVCFSIKRFYNSHKRIEYVRFFDDEDLNANQPNLRETNSSSPCAEVVDTLEIQRALALYTCQSNSDRGILVIPETEGFDEVRPASSTTLFSISPNYDNKKIPGRTLTRGVSNG